MRTVTRLVIPRVVRLALADNHAVQLVRLLRAHGSMSDTIAVLG